MIKLYMKRVLLFGMPVFSTLACTTMNSEPVPAPAPIDIYKEDAERIARLKSACEVFNDGAQPIAATPQESAGERHYR